MDPELRRRFTDSLKRAIPYGSDGPLLDDLVERTAKLAGSPSLPLPGESAAITFLNHKTAALCYDRVWAFGPLWVPDGIRFGGTTDVELDTMGRWFTLISVLFCSEDQETIEELGFTAEHLEFFEQEKERLVTELIEAIGGVRSTEAEVSFLDAHSRALSLDLNANDGLKTVPVYGSTEARELDFKPGDYSVIVATLSNLKIVSEADTSWEQVIEFRSDGEARRKYARLAHWLDRSFGGRSFSYIEDEISQRLSNCIIAFGETAEAVYCFPDGGCSATLSCCDVFGNAGGDWVDCIADQYGILGNFTGDPLFCDMSAGDLTLHADSPCAPEQSGACGLIGAWGEGCDPTPVEARSWGSIKARYK